MIVHLKMLKTSIQFEDAPAMFDFQRVPIALPSLGTLIELPPQRRQSRSQLLRGVHGAGHGSGRVAAADAAEAGTSAAGTCLGALGYGSNFKICKTCKTTDLNTLI